jgi:hypothetical protein
MSQRSDDDGAWRDPQRLPLADLDRAMATYSADGQVDDATGGDAGAEEAYPAEEERFAAVGEDDPDPDSEEGRRLRPPFTGRTGPV